LLVLFVTLKIFQTMAPPLYFWYHWKELDEQGHQSGFVMFRSTTQELLNIE